ncbi:MAG: mannosyltransferase family protein [Pseudomonadota bacterium]
MNHPVVFCAIAFILTRALLFAVGYLTYTEVIPLPKGPEWADQVASSAAWLDIWISWDSLWYLTIIENGYQAEPNLTELNTGQANWAFFPLYPLLASSISGAFRVDAPVAMLILSNVAFFAALLVTFSEARDTYNSSVAKMTVLLLVIWPGTHFFSSGYTESLFLLFLVSTLSLARKGHIFIACIVAALAALTRNLGVFLVFPIAIYAWQAWLAERDMELTLMNGVKFAFSRRGARVFFCCCLVPASLLIFMAHLCAVTGDPLAFVTIQQAWARSFVDPVTSLLRPILAPETIPATFATDFIILYLAPIPIIALALKRHWAYFSISLPLYVIPVIAGVVSLHRYVLVAIPLAMVIADYSVRHPKVGVFIVSLALPLSSVLMAFWAAGYAVI